MLGFLASLLSVALVFFSLGMFKMFAAELKMLSMSECMFRLIQCIQVLSTGCLLAQSQLAQRSLLKHVVSIVLFAASVVISFLTCMLLSECIVSQSSPVCNVSILANVFFSWLASTAYAILV